MNRDVDEVLASQNKMLVARGEATDTADDAKMREVYGKHLEKVGRFLRNRSCFTTLQVRYRDRHRQPRCRSPPPERIPRRPAERRADGDGRRSRALPESEDRGSGLGMGSADGEAVIYEPTMIDLHMHTTASDGTSRRRRIWRRARAPGRHHDLQRDRSRHDGGRARASAAAAREGLTCVPGIEVTTRRTTATTCTCSAISWTPTRRSSIALLARVRALRRERATEICGSARHRGRADRCRRLGEPGRSRIAAIDGAPADCPRADRRGSCRHGVGGFDRFLSEGCSAYVPHRGPSPAEGDRGDSWRPAASRRSRTRGRNNRDDIVAGLADAGCQRSRPIHSATTPRTVERYRALAHP